MERGLKIEYTYYQLNCRQLAKQSTHSMDEAYIDSTYLKSLHRFKKEEINCNSGNQPVCDHSDEADLKIRKFIQKKF